MSNKKDGTVDGDEAQPTPTRKQPSGIPNPEPQTHEEVPADQPKIWKWGDPYQYPLPKPDNDRWTMVLDEKIKWDKIQCDAWKEEVQNLLIFAGLFSGVVTAFIVNTFKNLSPNPNETVIFLLSRIANQTDITLSPPTFTRSASTVRINIYWFLSLILSLSTVLIGIIALQWLREHQKYTSDVASREYLAIFHMRALGLDAWHVRRIFMGLPLLLQVALILFFLGMIEFLLALDTMVAIPVIVVIILTLLFLIITTVLPSFQLLAPLDLDSYRGPSSSTPVQCPYKSPQAWICYRFVSRMYRLLISRSYFGSQSAVITPEMILLPFRYALRHSHNFQNWIQFDSWWLTIPEACKTTPEAHNLGPDLSDMGEPPWRALTRVIERETRPNLPKYVEAESLLEALRQYTSNPYVACALYYCVREVSAGDPVDDVGKRAADHLFNLYYIHGEDLSLYKQWAPSASLSDPLDFSRPSHACVQDEHMIWVLVKMLDHWQEYPLGLEENMWSHLRELNSRTTSYICSEDFKISTENGAIKGNFDDGIWYNFPGMQVGGSEVFFLEEKHDVMTTQLYLILDCFIRKAAELNLEEDPSSYTTYHPIIREFLGAPSETLGPAIKKPRAKGYLHPVLRQTLDFIRSTLDKARAEKTQRTLLFLSASHIMNETFKHFEKRQWAPVGDTYQFIDAGFEKWDPDPVYSEPIISTMKALFNYWEDFDPQTRPPFTNCDLYIWNVEPPFELQRFLIPVDNNFAIATIQQPNKLEGGGVSISLSYARSHGSRPSRPASRVSIRPASRASIRPASTVSIRPGP